MQSAVKNYIQTQVSTTTQGDLVIMLFDAALKYLHQAKEKIVEKNYAQKGILISKALDILAELQGSLNINKGGELADRLQKLYFFCSSRLLTANLKMDITKIDEVVGILSGLREAFSEANTLVTTKAVPTTATQATRTGVSASAALGLSHVGGSTATMPIGGLAPQTVAGRYAAAPTARPTAVPPIRPVAATTIRPTAAPTNQPATAPITAAATDPAAPMPTPRQELPVASAMPPQNAQRAEEPDDQLSLEAAQASRPTVSPVRRVMAAYGASRPNG